MAMVCGRRKYNRLLGWVPLALALVLALALAACGGADDAPAADPDDAPTDDAPGEPDDEPAAPDDDGDAAAPEPAELKPVTLRLDWRPEAYHAPFHLAQAAGYYAEEGLDLRVLDGIGSSDAVSLVGAGADDFGLASLSVVALARANEDVPVKAIAGYLQRAPDAVIARTDAGIETIQDLEGTTWGMVTGSSTTILFEAVAAEAGVSMDAINTVTIDAGARTPTLIRGDVDWVSGFAFTQAPVLEAEGVDYTFFMYIDYITFLGHGLIAGEPVIENDPDAVAAFVRGTLRGVEDAMANPQAAVDAMVAARPEVAGRADGLLRSLELMEDLLHTDNTEGEPLGYQAVEDWEEFIRLQQDFLDMEALEIDDVMTNEFLP